MFISAVQIMEAGEFTSHFKFYKRRFPPSDFSNVVDFDDIHKHQSIPFKIKEVELEGISALSSADDLGLISPAQWRCFTFEEKPGFLYIRNPFKPCTQQYWMRRCVNDFPFHPSVTNLTSTAVSGDQVKRYSHANLAKLRWTNLGYHYDWSHKVYKLNQHAAVPPDLVSLGQYIGRAIGYPRFTPESVIINYYDLKSTLTGHTDHAEKDLSAPIITLSLGQDAVFMLGGATKRDTPVTMFLHSGDVVVLSGESRLAYHAVPKVVTSPRAATRWGGTQSNEDTAVRPNRTRDKCGNDMAERTVRVCAVEREDRGGTTRLGHDGGVARSTGVETGESDDSGSEIEDDPYVENGSTERIIDDSEHNKSGPESNGHSSDVRDRECGEICEGDTDVERLHEYMEKNRINISLRQLFKTP